ncbi:MAG: hypothetical protein HY360_23450 [Verrucomicrobia bacterium]|nr:hypothetical protein [Verrucomicrobiota bacterium]
MKIELSNGVAIELLGRQRPHDHRQAVEFIGLGGISVGRVRLRAARRPFLVRADTPEGVCYARFQLGRFQRRRDQVAFELCAEGWPWGRTECHDEYNQQMIAVGHDIEPVTDKLRLALAPAELELGKRRWVGFSYSFEFRSARRKVHRLWTEATWEIGGSLVGNTVLHQGHCNQPVYRGAKRTVFTTHCLKTLHQYGSPLGSSFQLAPRGGLLQTFDFQYAAQGALLQFWPRMESIASLIESPPESELLHVIDEYRFELSNWVRTTPKWVLFSIGKLADHEARDLWWAAHEYVNGRIRARFRVQPTVAAPEIGLKYRSRVVGSKFRMTILDQEVDSVEVPYVIADRLFPRLAAQGIRRFISEVMSESDVTTLGMRRKLDDGVHGDLRCASVCATHRFLPSKFWGGLKAWRYMYEKAHAHGIELGAWFAPHLSPRAPIFQEHPEYRVIDQNSQPFGGGYSFVGLNTADWNTGIYHWVLRDLRRWKQEGGLDYLFTDSWPNLGLLPVNYAARMRTNFRPLGRLFHDIQKLGIQLLSFEGISPFGITRIGITDLQGAQQAQNRAVAGQNDFGWWVGHEDMAFGMCPMVSPSRRSARELERISFRALANRACITWDNQFDLNYRLPAWWVRLNHIYQRAVPHMQWRHLLPNGAGVKWTDGSTEILWLYHDLPLPPPQAGQRLVRAKMQRVERVTATGFVAMPATCRVLAGGQVYRLPGEVALQTNHSRVVR